MNLASNILSFILSSYLILLCISKTGAKYGIIFQGSTKRLYTLSNQIPHVLKLAAVLVPLKMFYISQHWK